MAAETPAQDSAAGGRKGLPMKTVLIVVCVMVIEAVAIGGAFLLNRGPSAVQADPAAETVLIDAMRLAEILVIAEKFQNTRTGRAYLYDTEVFVTVYQRDQALVEGRLEAMRAAIRRDLTTLFRRAEPAQLHEPELATLTRQIHAALEKRFGYNPDGEPYIQEVLIGKCTEFLANF